MDKIKVGITQGDINGVGYEIIIKALQDTRIFDFCTPIVYGSPKAAAYHRKAINVPNFSFNAVKNAVEASAKRVNIINCNDDLLRVELGKSTTIAGKSAYEALEAAVADLKANHIDVLVTAPINKHNIQSKDFEFPGHTEYLAKHFGQANELMLMVSEKLKVGVVTGHIPLNKVSENMTVEKIVEKLRVMNQSLKNDFSIRKPQIAVLGVNPHAGDNGLIGSEELEIIIPAIKQAQEEKIMALGPFAADGLFGSADYLKFDAILAMYHDQGLTPFKAMAFDTGVNFTAGLPIVRTSPGHGTAYDIAGKNKASHQSMLQAIYLACDIFKNRTENQELEANAMKIEK